MIAGDELPGVILPGKEGVMKREERNPRYSKLNEGFQELTRPSLLQPRIMVMFGFHMMI